MYAIYITTRFIHFCQLERKPTGVTPRVLLFTQVYIYGYQKLITATKINNCRLVFYKFSEMKFLKYFNLPNHTTQPLVTSNLFLAYLINEFIS